jgi:hypothetical protein
VRGRHCSERGEKMGVAGEQMADECRVIRGNRVYMWGRRRGTWWYEMWVMWILQVAS